MKTVVSTIESWKRQVEVEVPVDEVKPFVDKVYSDYQKKARIEGFRKGKVPLSLIKKRFKDAVHADVMDALIQTFFKKAVEAEKLAVVSSGKIQEIVFEEDKPFKFTAEVEVEPEVRVSDYKGLKVDKEVMKVTEEDALRTVEALREQKAERRPTDGGAEQGHIVEGDIQALDASGVPIIGEKWEERSFEMGSPPLGDLVLEQLHGIKKGEERRFKIVRPEQGPDGKAREHDDHYSIKVTSLQEKILPPLDDAFAKDVGDYETIKEFEEDILKRLEMQRDEEAERLLRNRIADDLVRRNDFEVPPSMVENALAGLWKEYEKRPNKDLDESQFREQNRASVLWSIKWHMIWKKIGDLEDLTVTEEAADDEVEKMANASSKESKKIRAWFRNAERRNHLKENLLEEKVIQFLKEHAKIKEVAVKKPKRGESSIIV